VCCRVLQCVAFLCVDEKCVFQVCMECENVCEDLDIRICVAVCCSVLQCVAVCCSVL